MSDWLNYKGIEVPDATPSGAAGLRLKEDLQLLVDWNPKSAWSAAADPTADDDVAEDFYPGSFWLNAQTETLFVCLDNAAGSAQWGRVLRELVEDPAPRLGGELDAGEHSIGFTEQTVAVASGAASIDWRQSNKAAIELDDDVELSFTAPSKPCNLLLRVVQDETGGWTITWPGSVKWPSGTAPDFTSAADAVDIVAFYFDGTEYYAVASLNFS